MPLGMDTGLVLGHIVLDGDPAPQKKGHSLPIFGPCGQTVGLIKMPLGTKVGVGPSDVVLDRDPAHPPEKGGTAPNFGPMSIVAKRSPISSTALDLYYTS